MSIRRTHPDALTVAAAVAVPCVVEADGVDDEPAAEDVPVGATVCPVITATAAEAMDGEGQCAATAVMFCSTKRRMVKPDMAENR